MRRSSLALAFVFIASIAAPAAADVVVTVSGGRITGKVIYEGDDAVKVKTDKGVVVTIRREEVESVVKERLEDIYARRLAKLDKEDVKGLVALAEWCEREKLAAQARECWEKVLKLDADNFEAREALGYRKIEGKWLAGDELKKSQGLVQRNGKWVKAEDAQLLDLGMVKKGDRWITKEEAEAEAEPDDAVINVDGPAGKPAGGGAKKSEPAPRAESIKPPKESPKPEPSEEPAPSVPIPPGKPGGGEPSATPKAEPISGEDKDLIAQLKNSRADDKRLEAIRALADRGESSRAALKAELEAELAKAKKDLIAALKIDRNQIRAKLLPLVAQRRADALAFIFDKNKYPEENHGAVGQPEVDRLVGLLRRAYEDPLREVSDPPAKAGGGSATMPKLQKLLDEAKKLAGWLREHAGGDGDPAKVEDELCQEANRIVKMRLIPTDDKANQNLTRSLEVMKYNETVKTSMTAEEKTCVRVTNEYRMMFGMIALKIFEPLVQAARKHSVEMVKLNYFAHESPVAENASPEKRCAREGGHFVGENIAMGSPDGLGTFNQWYTSSGHHRNMLMKGHKSIGIGEHQANWTEDFGADDPQ